MVKNFKIISCTVILTVLLSTMIVFAQATSKITVEQINADAGGSVSVPIRIENNTGICGAMVAVEYDKNLVLTAIEKGTALTTLTMTNPGDFSSNPINIGWDGMDEDSSNGVIATLIFTVPDIVGTYNIKLSYEDGNIVDGNLDPITVDIQNGGITIQKEESEDMPTITVGNVTTSSGGSISVPVQISNNTGICGATISILYDEELVLTAVEKGTALASLTMTNPGKLSDNPINIGWDGMDADTSNGIIAILTFTVPDVSGSYQIVPSYTGGDVVDGALQPVNLKMNKGQITVGGISEVTVKVDGKRVTLKNDSGDSGKILVAFYAEGGKLISLKDFLPQSEPIEVDNIESASYAKVMWWNNLSMMKPLCEARIIDLE